MADYPEGLPGPILNGYSSNNQQAFIRTQFITGRARNRKLYSYVPQYVDAQFVLTAGEMRIFESWYQAVANDGEAWFNIELTLPTGSSKREARFVQAYDGPRPYGPFQWSYTASLELRERASFPASDYLYDPLGIEYADVLDITVNSYLDA